MRLSLTRLCMISSIATLGCAGTAVHEATSRVHVYDDPRITVVTPAVRDDMRIGDSRLTASYAVDAVSGATLALTVDAVSSATQFSEIRHQASIDVTHALPHATELSAGYSLNLEPDHRVHAPWLGFSAELQEQMVRASVRYQLLAESIGRVDDAAYAANALGHRLDFGSTHILTPAATLALLVTLTGFDCSANLGCFASSYRYVGVTGPTGGPLALSERHPETRFTGAGALRLARAFGDASAFHAGYRFFRDSWGIGAHTADVAVATEMLEDRLFARGEVRGTVQDAASFYRSSYRGDNDSVPAYRTADAEVSSLWNLRLLLHLEWAWGPARIVGEFGRFWSHYPDFHALPKRHAWVGGVGLDLEL